MKYKGLILILALTVAAWAQTANSNQQASTPPEKTKCACCDSTTSAHAEEGQSCARHMAKTADGKPITSCCDQGDKKDGKSCCGKDAQCMKGGKAACCSDNNKDKTAASCCVSACAKSCGRACGSGKPEKASRSCCHKVLQSQSS